MMMPVNPKPPRKLSRISRACDACHRRSVRCKPSGDLEEPQCLECMARAETCTYNRMAKKRGAKPRKPGAPASLTTRSASSIRSSTRGKPNRELSERWQAPLIASQAVVMDLVEIYFEIAYPIFPFFHQPTFLRKIARGEYNNDRYLFAATMSVCALVSGRIRDGAVFNPQWDTGSLQATATETFYDAATRECRGFKPSDASNLNLLRASALLAVAAIQANDSPQMQLHLGRYQTLFAMSGLHDESQWPKSMGIVETEERRRLFWSVYTLELFTSIVWNSMARCREQQCNVSYPTELDDEQFDDTGYRPTSESPLIIGPSPGQSSGYVRGRNWLAGWNFTTDLYRVLEHVTTHFRDRRRGRRSFLTDIFGDRPTISATSVKDSIMNMYAGLPQCFKETRPITYDKSLDRYGFQAANITATVQLLRMVLFASGGGTIEERCQIASEVVDAFIRIPVEYLRAISSPLLHHLAGIGVILGSVLGDPLTESEYQQVRLVLLSLAQLLENLNHGIHHVKSADMLRAQVSKIDDFMEMRGNNLRAPLDTERRTEAALGNTATLQLRASDSVPASTQYDYNRDTRDDANIDTQLQLPADILDGWPWTLDFMQFPEE